MILTEDRVAKELAKGGLTISAVKWLFDNDKVHVYGAVVLPTEATYDDIGDRGEATSTIFYELRNAGATEADMADVGLGIQRARDEGRTIDAALGHEDT